MTVTLWKTLPQPVNLRKIVDRAYSCTCHVPNSSRFGRHDLDPRPAILLDGSTEWQHVNDGTAATMIHVHVDRQSADCDGGHGDTYVNLPNDGEDEWDFWDRSVTGIVHAYSPGTLTIDGGMNNATSATWSAATDEGFIHETVTRCTDSDCAYGVQHRVWDQYAELAGY